jgi:hypothetical protein
MRAELRQAQEKVRDMQHGLRTAERNLDVSRVDRQEMNKSLASHVNKIDSLLGLTRHIRQTRADMQVDMNGTRRRFEYRTEVRPAFWAVSFPMI